MSKTKKSDVGLSNQIALNDYQTYLEHIKNGVDGVMTNYIKIGYYLNQLSKNDLFKEGNYESIFQLGINEFNLSETTIKNSIGVAIKYCDENGNLKEEFQDFKFSALVELLPVETEKVLVDYKPEMTVKEIRDKKKTTKSNKHQISIDEIDDDINKDLDDSLEDTKLSNSNEEFAEVTNYYSILNNEEIKNIHPFIYHFLNLFIHSNHPNIFIKIVNKIEINLYLDSDTSEDNPIYLIVKYSEDELTIDCYDPEIDDELKMYLENFKSFISLFKNLLDLQPGN